MSSYGYGVTKFSASPMLPYDVTKGVSEFCMKLYERIKRWAKFFNMYILNMICVFNKIVQTNVHNLEKGIEHTTIIVTTTLMPSIFQSSLCNSFEDHIPPDSIYQCLILKWVAETWHHGPLTRYIKLWVAHALGMPGTFSPPLTSKETAS